jgi:hypothetical protein
LSGTSLDQIGTEASDDGGAVFERPSNWSVPMMAMDNGYGRLVFVHDAFVRSQRRLAVTHVGENLAPPKRRAASHLSKRDRCQMAHDQLVPC